MGAALFRLLGALIVGFILTRLFRWIQVHLMKLSQGAIPGGPHTRPTQSPLDPYSILGISQGASRKEIRDAYHQKLAQYHPDKVAQMGEEIRNVAEHKTKEINAAYSTLNPR